MISWKTVILVIAAFLLAFSEVSCQTAQLGTKEEVGIGSIKFYTPPYVAFPWVEVEVYPTKHTVPGKVYHVQLNSSIGPVDSKTVSWSRLPPEYPSKGYITLRFEDGLSFLLDYINRESQKPVSERVPLTFTASVGRQVQSERTSVPTTVATTKRGVEVLRPNGPGSETSVDTAYPSWGSHWEKVSESVPDEDDTYVENKNGPVGSLQRDLYTVRKHSSSSGTIDKLIVIVRTKSNIPSENALLISIRTHGVVFDYDKSLDALSVWANISQEMAVNPYTRTAWTWDDINNLEIGVALGGSIYGPDWSRCTQLYAEVYYH